jgi:hypothetical protein
MVQDEQLGSYEPSDPANPQSQLTCQLNPTFHFVCNGVIDQLCFTWVAHPITPASSPPQNWAPFFAGAVGNLSGDAGTIGSAPTQKGVVNTPVCFWIDNMGIPAERDLVLTLAGAPDNSGRQVFYTFLAAIRFDHLTWNFDDPSGSTTTVTPPLACGQHSELVAHSYSQISDDRNLDHMYHVSVQEFYTISVQVFWIDSTGFQHHPVDPGVTIPPISPITYSQYVGQVEGIPLGGP